MRNGQRGGPRGRLHQCAWNRRALPRVRPGAHAHRPRSRPLLDRSVWNPMPGAGRTWLDSRRSRRRSDRHGELERRAFAWLAFDPDAAAVQLDDLLADREAQAGADHLVRLGALESFVAPEHFAEVFGRNADAVIANSDIHLSVSDVGTDDHLSAFGRVLDRIGQQVADHLDQSVGVGVDDGEGLVELSAERVTVTGSPGTVDDHAYQRVHIDRLRLDVDLSRLHPVEVQHLVDHPVQSLGIVEDVARQALHVLGAVALGRQDLAEALDAD